jgi:fatty acid desaturase
VPSRLGWFVLHCAIIVSATLGITHDLGGLPGRLAFSLLIGHSFAGLAFVGHETLHGSVVKGARWIRLLGFACFLPFTVAPTLWTAWHNRVHHGHTMAEGIDPDAFPTLAEYRHSRLLRIADRYALGRGHWVGALPLFVAFTVQTLQILLNASRHPRYFSPRQRRRAFLETAAGIGFWVALGVWIGPVHFLFAYGIPLLLGNAVVTTYILTNHSLSPLTSAANDPLLNSLSVLVPQPLARLHLDFGLHVEHHLFPSMSSRYAGGPQAAHGALAGALPIDEPVAGTATAPLDAAGLPGRDDAGRPEDRSDLPHARSAKRVTADPLPYAGLRTKSLPVTTDSKRWSFSTVGISGHLVSAVCSRGASAPSPGAPRRPSGRRSSPAPGRRRSG